MNSLIQLIQFKMKSLGVLFYIVLVDKTRCGVNIKLEIWRDALEYK